MRRPWITCALLATLATPGWAASDRDDAQKAFVEGAKAVQAKDLPRALERFRRAAALDPGNANYAQALTIARQSRITELVQASAKARLMMKDEEASAELREAFALDREGPEHNPMIAERLEELARDRERAQEPALLHAKVDTSQAAPALLPRVGVGKKSIHLYASPAEVVRAVFQTWGLTPLIDKSVQPAPGGDPRVHYDQDDVDWPEALRTVELATGTFAVPLDPQRAVVALDTKANRTLFERLTEETVYLPGITQPEMTDLANVAKNVFEAAQANADPSAGAMVVRMPATRMEAFNVMLRGLMAGKSEVMLHVDFYEIDRTKTENVGAELPNSSTIFNVTSEVRNLINANPTLVQEIISQGLASPGNYLEIAEALIASGQAGSSILSQPFAYFGGGLTLTGLTLNGGTLNALLNVSDTRLLDSVQLRLQDGDPGIFKVGERYPIVTSSYSNLATGNTALAGISSTGLSTTLSNLGISSSALAAATTPQVQYQDLGLTLEATPRIEGSHDVTLKLNLEMTSLNGQTLNSNPVLNNRKYETITSLAPGEQAVVVSALSDQETHALTGIPFVSEIPGMHLWTNDDLQDTSSSLVIILTPQIVRLSHVEQAGPMVVLPQHS